jgi:hypothetical protein
MSLSSEPVRSGCPQAADDPDARAVIEVGGGPPVVVALNVQFEYVIVALPANAGVAAAATRATAQATIAAHPVE